MQRNVELSGNTFFQAFCSVMRSFTSSPCFKAPTASSLSPMLSFYRTNINMEPIGQVKSNLR